MLAWYLQTGPNNRKRSKRNKKGQPKLSDNSTSFRSLPQVHVTHVWPFSPDSLVLCRLPPLVYDPDFTRAHTAFRMVVYSSRICGDVVPASPHPCTRKQVSMCFERYSNKWVCVLAFPHVSGRPVLESGINQSRPNLTSAKLHVHGSMSAC